MTFDEFSTPGYLTHQGALIAITGRDERHPLVSLFVQKGARVKTILLSDLQWATLADALGAITRPDHRGRIVVEGSAPERSITIARIAHGYLFRVHVLSGGLDLQLTTSEVGDLAVACRTAASPMVPVPPAA